jgi:hypothetical protein
MSLAAGVVAGTVVLAGLLGSPFGPQPSAGAALADAQLAHAVFVSVEGEPGAPIFGPTPANRALGNARSAHANLRWTVEDWRCPRTPVVDAVTLTPRRIAPAQLELSTRLPDRY